VADGGAAGPLAWSVARLVAAYRMGELSPVDVIEAAIERAERIDPALHAYLDRLDDAARAQARAAERAYREDAAGPLAGVPVSIKDTFPLAGSVTTFGSWFYRDHRTDSDSGCVHRLRESGAVFPGKTSTAEFGQSATSENRLGPEPANPWDPSRTPGGSSGGAAAGVATGLATVALAADGGGSIRIPAAFTGLFGVKPTYGLVTDEGGLRAMSDFVCPGPLARRVADARAVLGVLASQSLTRGSTPAGLRVAWCPRPEDRPVDPGVAAHTAAAAARLAELGHRVEERSLPLAGWKDAFGPLVLAEEGRERGHLLEQSADALTDYERGTLEAARSVDASQVDAARFAHLEYAGRLDALFDQVDVLLTPTTATPAFPAGKRPRTVDGQRVGRLWGAVPFAVPFNVSGQPAASVPCGLAEGLPVGVQLVMRRGADAALLDLCEDLEEALGFDSESVIDRWSARSAGGASP
jgi:aspartyl-tRNA(Asn)/glutamyl-tRNA(Gln) amidotransferase subunit A